MSKVSDNVSVIRIRDRNLQALIKAIESPKPTRPTRLQNAQQFFGPVPYNTRRAERFDSAIPALR